jgi:hypothetical protein
MIRHGEDPANSGNSSLNEDETVNQEIELMVERNSAGSFISISFS